VLRNLEKAIWWDVAYVCRYGKQPLTEVLGLSLNNLHNFKIALAAIVEQENK
jgi:hypothetical protein